MKLLIIAAAFLSFGIWARSSEGAEKAKKPSVCVDYEFAQTKGGRIAVCYDGKKPVVFNMFSEVMVSAGVAENPQATVKVLVGWR